MSNPWFRFYSEFANDAKVQMMSEQMQRRLVMLFCLQNSNALRNGCTSVTDTEVAFMMRINDVEIAQTKALFIERGFINNDWELANWDKRQFRSDVDPTRAERQKRYRERNSNALRNGRVTVLDTDTDTDTDTDNKNHRGVAGKKKKPPAAPFVLPESIPTEAWKDWHNYRNSKKGWTDKAKQLSLITLNKLVAKGHDPQTIINTSIERGYTGLFEPKTQGANHDKPRESIADRAAQRAADIFERLDAQSSQGADEDMAYGGRRLGKPLVVVAG